MNEAKALEIQRDKNKPITLQIIKEAVTNVSDESTLAMIVELVEVVRPDFTTTELATALVKMKPAMEQLQKSRIKFVDTPPKTLPEF